MTLQDQNTIRWKNCHIPADKGPQFKTVADKIYNNKYIYQEIETATGVPWWFIGIVHYREANLNMSSNIAQGDPWNKKSVHVPVGRGPFKSFKDAAVDALTKCQPYAARNKDWTVGGALTLLEKYNGLGYAQKGLPSPYIWAGTDQYVKGKYIADGKYSPDTVDKQLGCAGLIKFLGIYATGNPAASASTVGAGALVVGAGAAMSATPHHYWPWIVGVTAFSLVTGSLAYLIHNYRKGQ